MRPFVPIVRNPDLLTILANFWPRNLDFSPFPADLKFYRTEPDVEVLVTTQHPVGGGARGAIVMLHGLEGSGNAGYIQTLAHAALTQQFTVHRFHMRTCGGTEDRCPTLYHAGLTSDLLEFLRQMSSPAFLVGFSLGGNVALKLAGELGEKGAALIRGVCAISTPIDLAVCTQRLGQFRNRIYERRFLQRMRKRLFATGRYTREQLERPRSIYEIDDQITAPSFGFTGADHYYATQSAQNFLHDISVPTLIIEAKDDPFIPWSTYTHPALHLNPAITLIVTDHGGHLGFLSREAPRFWLDETVLEWIKQFGVT